MFWFCSFQDWSENNYLLPHQMQPKNQMSDSRGCKKPGFTVFALCNLQIPIAFRLPSFLDFSPCALCCQLCTRLMEIWFEFTASKMCQTSLTQHWNPSELSSQLYSWLAVQAWQISRLFCDTFPLSALSAMITSSVRQEPSLTAFQQHMGPWPLIRNLTDSCSAQNKFSTPVRAGGW